MPEEKSRPEMADVYAILEESKYALRVLMLLGADREPVSSTSLMHRISTSPPTVVRCIRVLTEKGAVEERLNSEHRRRYGLTPMGEVLLESLGAEIARIGVRRTIDSKVGSSSANLKAPISMRVLR